MYELKFKSYINKYLSVFGFDKKSYMSIKEHYKFSNNQIIILIWFKGVWTGVLISLVLHNFISH